MSSHLLQPTCQKRLPAPSRANEAWNLQSASDAARRLDRRSMLSPRGSEATEVFGDRVSMLAGLLPQFTWREAELPEGVRIELGGPLTIEEAPALWKRLSTLLENSAGKARVQID